MKKLLLLLFVFVLPSLAFGQLSSTGSITASGTDCNTTNACIQLTLFNTANLSTSNLSVTAAGTFTGTLQFEASADKAITWVSISGVKTDGTGASSSTSSTGVWLFSIAAFTHFRVRASLLSSGSATVTLQASSGNTVTTAGQNLSPASLNGNYFVDGVTYANAGAVYASNPSGLAGPLIIPNPTGSLLLPADPFLNTATVSAPQITLLSNANCGNVATDARLAAGNVITAEFAYYDATGHEILSATTTSAASDATGTQCYQVQFPGIILGAAAYSVFAGTCASPGPCATLSLQISSNQKTQIVTTASNKWNLTTSAYANCANGANNINNNGGSAANWMCGALPIAANPGLHVTNTTVKFQAGVYRSAVPVTIAGNGGLYGMAQKTTVFQLDATAPNGIPTPIDPYGVLTTSTTNNKNTQLTLQYAYTDGAGGASNIIGLSQPVTMQPFPPQCDGVIVTANCTVTAVNPSPPLIFGAWLPSMRQWESQTGGQAGGSRITDCNLSSGTSVCLNPTSVWTMCGKAGEACGTTPNFSGSTGTTYPFASNSCATAGTSFIDDGGIRWLCILKGVAWDNNGGAGHVYAAGAEVWDNTNGVFQEQLVGATCTGNVGAAPTFRAAFAAVSPADGTCFWMNIGQNIMVNPGFEVFGVTCAITVANNHCVTGPTTLKVYNASSSTNATRFANPVNYDFNGWTSFQGAVAIQPTGAGATQSTYTATGAGAASPPVPTVSAPACPAGFGGGTWTGNVIATYLWATPMGVIPQFGETVSTAVTNNTNCLQINAPSNPPPNAVGWVVGIEPATSGVLNEDMQPADGINLICGNGALNQYAPSIQHGAFCALGVNATVVKQYAQINTNTTNPTPWFNTSDANLWCVTGPFQVPNTSEQFYAQVMNMQLSPSRNLSTLEPYGVGWTNKQCQEHSGLWSVEILGAAGADGYTWSSNAQNSMMNDVQDIGANSDYKQSWRFEDSPFRGILGGTLSAGTGGGQWLNRNSYHVLGTPWRSFVGVGPTLAISSEAALDGVECDLAQCGVIGTGTTPTAGRKPLNNVHFGPFSQGGFVIGFGSVSPTCPIQDDMVLGFTTGCRITSQFRGSSYFQRNSTQILNADSAAIAATTPATGTILFSWFKGSQDQGRYALTCNGSYTNSVGTADGLGIALQTALASAPVAAGSTVDTGAATMAGAYVTFSGTTTATAIIETVVSPVAGAGLPFSLTGWVDVSNNGTQFNVIFYSKTGGNTVIQKGTSCTLNGT